MSILLRQRNVVLIGGFNPAFFDKYFFITNDILKDEEIQPSSQFLGIGGVQVISEKYSIIIVLNQIIITFLKQETTDADIKKFISLFIKKGNIKNVQNMGFNFNWHIVYKDKDAVNKASRNFFYHKENKVLAAFFDSDDASYGMYASKNFEKARLKFDVKPAKIQEIGKNEVTDEIVFGFNYDFVIKNKETDAEILELVDEYSVYSEGAKKITSIFI